jgi:hypothetical protein
MPDPQRRRSTLPREQARRRYVAMGELAVLEQIRRDAERAADALLPVGPFARLDANAVAARDGKTRGAITNLFGSQAAYRAETMAQALNAEDWIAAIEHPAPEGFADAEEWLDALLAGESARGPEHGAEPAVGYGSLWALWLSTVPYGLWSEGIAEPSMDEYRETLGRLEDVLRRALRHFDVSLRDGVEVGDLAFALASAIEGAWLNQCLTGRHPADPSEPIATALRRTGRLLWRGATEPAPR